jgi:hypothetical protein
MERDFAIECPWCQVLLVVTVETWIDGESGRPRVAFRNDPERATALHAHWHSHAAERADLLAGRISPARPLRPGWPVDDPPPAPS